MGDDLTFDPFDPEQTHRMFELTARLRARCPVSRPQTGFVYLAQHADNARVFRDAKSFANAGGFRQPDVELSEDEQTLGEMDPPLHPRVRRLMMKAFTPAMAEQSRPFASTYATRLVRAFAERGGGDAVAEVTLPLPIAVTADLLGLPESDVALVGAWSFEIFNSTWPATNRTEHGEGLAGAFPEFSAYMDAHIAQRRAATHPGTDLLTRMVHAEDGGNRFNDVQLRTLASNMLLGSLSTTLLMANMLYRWARDPGFEAALRAKPEVVPAAVEESLRLEPPVLLLFRTARTDVELSSGRVNAGERIITGIASANRDENVFDDPDEFLLDRAHASDHLSFGVGPHQCIGKDVARMEAQELLRAVVRVLQPGQLQLPPDFEYEYVPHFLEYGPERMPLLVQPADTNVRTEVAT